MIYTPLIPTFSPCSVSSSLRSDLACVCSIINDLFLEIPYKCERIIMDRNLRLKFRAKMLIDHLFLIRYRKEVLSFFSEIEFKVTKLYYIKQLY